MRATIASFKMMLKHISRDGMLAMICFIPLLVVFLLGYVMPAHVEPLLSFDITEYYLLFDLMMAVMTPYFICFVSALAILEEIDENITPYLSVTPIGKGGYLVSRLFLPTIISALITILFLALGSTTKLSVGMNVALSISTAILAMIVSMIIVCFAKNKVEGMALSKISGLLIVGLFIPSFITSDTQYIFGFMPSFWIAKLAISDNYLYLLPITACSTVWIIGLRKVYVRKL